MNNKIIRKIRIDNNGFVIICNKLLYNKEFNTYFAIANDEIVGTIDMNIYKLELVFFNKFLGNYGKYISYNFEVIIL